MWHINTTAVVNDAGLLNLKHKKGLALAWFSSSLTHPRF